MLASSRSPSRTLWVVLLAAVAGMSILGQSQAVCIIQSVYTPAGMIGDICSYSLSDCSTITNAALMSNYALKGVTVQPVMVMGIAAPNRVAVTGAEAYMIKAVLASQLQGCYVYGKTTMTIYGTNSATV